VRQGGDAQAGAGAESHGREFFLGRAGRQKDRQRRQKRQVLSRKNQYSRRQAVVHEHGK